MTLIDILKNSVGKNRKRTAFIMRPRYREIRWTYGDLWNFAVSVAELLEKEGVKKGEPVLLWSPNSPYWGGAFFGILLRGGVAVPLHAENTQEFIEKVALNTGARVLLKASLLKSNFNSGLKIFDIDGFGAVKSDLPKEARLPDIIESDLAEIIYTSGTTGDPKGVMLSHGNIVSNLLALAASIPVWKFDRFLSILPLSHMFEQVGGFLFPVLRGARIIYIPRTSSGLITKALREHHVTKMLAVPQFLDTVMKKIEARAREEGRERALDSARHVAGFLPWPARRILFHKIHKRMGGWLLAVASGGAPLDPVLERKWELLGIKLLQGYGLTETSPILSVNTFWKHRFSSTGKPVSGVEVKIAPDGEILARGPNVFSGYYKNEEKTREVFTPDGWFKTGDLGEVDKNGFVYVRGRKKYMIKGPAAQNIYPEDLEFEINKQPGVKDSAVVGLEKDHRVEIHAVLLLEEGVNPEAVVEAANAKLASFQRVQNWSLWPDADFPRSATRKIQKEKVLEWLKYKPVEPKAASSREATPMTKLLGEIFGKAPEEITPDTKLVSDLGMDSILRIELVTRMEEAFGITLEEKLLTQKTGVAELEALIKERPKPETPEEPLKNRPFAALTRLVREILYWIFVFPIFSGFVNLRVFNQEVFREIKGPFLLMPNHRSYLDSVVILMSLPLKIRSRLAFAAAKDVLRSYWWARTILELFFATFSFPREEKENVEQGLEATGKLLDRGFSVAVYPEGRQSPGKELLPLKRGAGLLGVEMEVPVIPVFIDGTEYVLPRDKIIPRRRGEVKVYFGNPLYFKKTDNYIDATQKIEAALRKLKSAQEESNLQPPA